MTLSLRTEARQGAINALHASGSFIRAKQRIASMGHLVVLTFHRIVADQEIDKCRSPRGMILRESLFRRLIDHLSETANVISPHEIDETRSKRNGPRVLLTFDDGWIDNIEVALPYLTAAKMHAYFFVPTSLVGHTNPFWPERMQGLLNDARADGNLAILQHFFDMLQHDGATKHPALGSPKTDEALLTWLKRFSPTDILSWIDAAGACLPQTSHSHPSRSRIDPRERLMTWDQLRVLVAAGHCVGSHTCTHALLPDLHPKDLDYELVVSRQTLQDQLSLSTSDKLAISYPNGSISPAVALAAFRADYRFGFSTAIGVCRPTSDPLQLPRINIWDGTVTDHRGAFCAKRLDYALFWKALGAGIIS